MRALLALRNRPSLLPHEHHVVRTLAGARVANQQFVLRLEDELGHFRVHRALHTSPATQFEATQQLTGSEPSGIGAWFQWSVRHGSTGSATAS